MNEIDVLAFPERNVGLNQESAEKQSLGLFDTTSFRDDLHDIVVPLETNWLRESEILAIKEQSDEFPQEQLNRDNNSQDCELVTTNTPKRRVTETTIESKDQSDLKRIR